MLDWLDTTFKVRVREFEWVTEDALEYGGFILLVKSKEAYHRVREGCQFAVCLADFPLADPTFFEAIKPAIEKRIKYLEYYYTRS